MFKERGVMSNAIIVVLLMQCTVIIITFCWLALSALTTTRHVPFPIHGNFRTEPLSVMLFKIFTSEYMWTTTCSFRVTWLLCDMARKRIKTTQQLPGPHAARANDSNNDISNNNNNDNRTCVLSVVGAQWRWWKSKEDTTLKSLVNFGSHNNRLYTQKWLPSCSCQW